MKTNYGTKEELITTLEHIRLMLAGRPDKESITAALRAAVHALNKVDAAWRCPTCDIFYTDSFVRCYGCQNKRSERFSVNEDGEYIKKEE